MLRRVLVHFLLPLCIIAGGVVVAGGLLSTAQTTKPTDPDAVVPPVETMVAVAYSGPMLVAGNGTIEADRQVTVSPQISGRVLEVSAALVDGGRVKEGDLLVRIDDRDYHLAVKQQTAALRRAQLDVELEQSAGDAAKREWSLSGRAPKADARRIAHRVPQLELAKANVDAARAAVQSSKLDLTRAGVRAPFNATVVSESVELGDVVAPGSVLARLVGTDRFVARVSLPVEHLASINTATDDVPGSTVTLTQRLGHGDEIVRKGTVLRVLSELDQGSRTAQILVGIDAPLDPPPGEQPMYVGAFVRAEFQGAHVESGVVVPHHAIFEGARLWVLDDKSRLQLRKLDIAFSRDHDVIVRSGLDAGDRVVVTTVPGAIPGMRVRVIDPTADSATEAVIG